MYTDFLTFLKHLPWNSTGSGSIVPDSFREQLPSDAFSGFLAQLNSTAKILGAIITLILALVVCLFGYKLVRFFMTGTGFLVGGVLGFVISALIFELDTPFVILATFLGGLVIALLAYRIYVGGIFLLCSFLGFVAAAALLPLKGDLQFFLSILIGFIIGSLAIRFIRPVIILSSALAGGTMAAGLIVSILGSLHIYEFSKLTGGGLIILVCGLGILVQFLTTKDPDQKKKEKEKANQ